MAIPICNCSYISIRYYSYHSIYILEYIIIYIVLYISKTTKNKKHKQIGTVFSIFFINPIYSKNLTDLTDLTVFTALYNSLQFIRKNQLVRRDNKILASLNHSSQVGNKLKKSYILGRSLNKESMV